jgi:RNA polymerase sigma-70 factor (ECF subfamily)
VGADTMEAVQVDPPAEAQQVASDFVECYLAHYKRLVRALQLGGADAATAEDLAQEAFARALVKWRRVSRGPNPPGYVYTTGFRLLRRDMERTARRREGDLPAAGPPAVDADPTTALAMEAALARMPPRRRSCAVMCLVVGMSVHEAGAALGIADGTVRKHLDEARRDLASQL